MCDLLQSADRHQDQRPPEVELNFKSTSGNHGHSPNLSQSAHRS